MCVIVTVDDSPAAEAAIRLAATEAGYRNRPLVAVTAYSSEGGSGAPAARPAAILRTPSEERAAAKLRLRNAVDAALGDDAAAVRQKVIAGPPGRGFVRAARESEAELLVLPTRRSMSGLPGTAGQYVLRHAPCPVLMVPDGAGRSRSGVLSRSAGRKTSGPGE